VIILRPRIGINGTKQRGLAVASTNTLVGEVAAVDKNLVLASRTHLADEPLAIVQADAWGRGPSQVSRGWVDLLERVVASVEEANGDGIGREPANLCVPKFPSRRVNVHLQRLSADLHQLLATLASWIAFRGETYRVQLSIIVHEESGDWRVPPLVVRLNDGNALLQSQGIIAQWAGASRGICRSGVGRIRRVRRGRVRRGRVGRIGGVLPLARRRGSALV
jgi:hypothetical protein